MPTRNKTDVMVLGAGAAGMICAVEAGRRGLSVTVIDHARAPGRKNPYLGRWTVQFHQSALRAWQLSVEQPALCDFRAQILHPA